MGIGRKLAAAVACAAHLSVASVGTAGARGPGRCEKVARINEKVEQQLAKVSERRARLHARQQEQPRAADWVQKHQARLDAAVARIEAKATTASRGCTT